jgi:hypothetical protein
MTMEYRDFYKLTFDLNSGKTRSFTVRGAKPGLSAGVVAMQVNKIMASGALNGENGSLTGCKKALAVTEIRDNLVS